MLRQTINGKSCAYTSLQIIWLSEQSQKGTWFPSLVHHKGHWELLDRDLVLIVVPNRVHRRRCLRW